jgi:hypothetical protein
MLADIRAGQQMSRELDADEQREKHREEWLAFPERDDDESDEVAA